MNGKKIISLLCASALSVSSFAGLSMSVAAENTAFYSNGINNYLNDSTVTLADGDLFNFTDGSTTGWSMTNGTVETKTDDMGEYLQVQGSGSGNRTLTYALPTAAEGEYTIEFDTMMTRNNGMGRIMHSTQIAFTSDVATMDTRNGANILDTVNTEQGSNYKENYGASVANAALKIDLRPYMSNKWMVNDDSSAELVAYPEEAVDVTDATWVRVQASVNGDKTTVTAIDNAGNKIIDGVEYANALNKVDSIYICSGRGDNGSGIVALDNVRIYSGAADELTTDGLRGTAELAPVPTVMPAPATKKQALKLKAPSSATVVLDNDFSKAIESVSMGESEQEVTTVDGLSVHFGSRGGGDTTTAVSTEEWANGDKVLTLTGGKFSGGGRGPEVTAVDALEIPDDGSSSSVMTFMVNLSSNKAGGAGRLYIVKDNSKAGSDNMGAYNRPMAVLTTDDTAANYTIGSGDNIKTIGYQVEAYEWYKVAVVVSNGKFRVWIAKADEDFTMNSQIESDHVGTGDTSASVNSLPMLAVTSAKGGEYTGSVVRIDNMLTYTGSADEPRKLLPSTEAAPTPAPEVTTTVDETAKTVTLKSNIDTAVWLIQASYLTDGTFDSIKKLEKCELTANTDKVVTLDSLTMGDKIMVWADENGKMSAIPLSGSVDVETGDAQKTPEPTETPVETVKPTETPAETTKPTETPAETVKPTETPAETVKPTETPAETVKPTEKPTETVKPTEAPATYKVNVAEKITGGNVSVDKTTAKEGEEVTVKAEADDGYVFGKITVTADGEKTVDVKDNKFTMPASDVTVSAEFNVKTYTVTGTVDAGVEAVSLVPAEGSEIKGTITDTTVTFEKVAAGTYTVKATAKYGYKKAAADKSSVEVTADASSAFAVTTTARTQQAYTAGTATYDEENATAKFVDYSRTTTSVVASTAGNNTSNVESIKTGTGGQSGAGYNIYTEEYPAEGETVAVSFDVNIPARNAWVSVRGTKPGSGNRDNNNTNRIFTVGAEGSYNLKIYNGGDTVTVANTDLNNNWYHIDAVVNNKEKTVAIKVYDYQSTNDYEDLTALYEGTVPFRDNTVKGVVAMDYYSNTNNANMWLDNIYVNDPTWTAPKEVNVTAPESTDGAIAVDMKNARAGATVTITSTPATGKKTSAVKVVKADGTEVDVTKGENDTYTFVMPEENVTVSAEYARADIAALELSGLSTVSTGSQYTYTVVAKAADGTVITPNEGEIEWRVEGHSPSGSTGIENGVLSVWGGEAAPGSTVDLTVIAYIKDNTNIKAEMKVTVTAEKTYEITKAEDIVGGSVSTSVSAAAAGNKVVVNVNPDAGYGIKRVFYTKVEEKEDVVSPTFTTAKLHDTASENPVADDDIIKDYAVTEEEEDGYTVLKFAGKDLKEHTNGAGDKGYWVGAAITAPEGKEIAKYYFAAEQPATDAEYGEVGEDDKQTIEFYTNVGAEDKKVWAGIELNDGTRFIYKLDTEAVTKFGDTGAEVEMLGEIDEPESNSSEVEIVKGSDGSYSFEMPEYPVKISAEFEKVDLAITNKTAADANGKITVAEKAKLGDVVEVTVEPGDGYELASLTYKGDSYNSEIEETAITKNTEGKYTFVMPSEAVQVKATFIKTAIVRDVVEGVKVLSTYDTTATRLGDRNVLQAPSGNKEFTSQEVLTNNVTLDTDFLVSDDEVLYITLGRSSGQNFSGQTSTLIITGKDGKITMQGQNGSSSYTGLDWTTVPTLESGKWYRMVVSSVMTGNASPNAKLSIYAVDENTCAIGDKLGEGTLKHRTGSDAEWNRIQWGSTGTPSIDNAYVYTNDKYETTVTVTDGENVVEGAVVKVNDVLNTTATTDAEGKVKFDLIAGEYTVTVEKAGYDAPEEIQTISVGKENANALTIAMAEKKQTLTTMTIDGGMENHTVLTKGADTVVAKLSVSGKDANGDEMGVMPAVTWSSDSENTTVENGVVTVKSTQGAGTVTITATAENDVKAEYKITVAETGTEVVLLATDDFEGKTSIFEVKNGAAIEEAFTNNNVLKLGGTAADVATATFATPVTAETGKKIDVSYNTYNGWLSKGKNIIWTLKNSNGEKVLEYTYDTNGCKVTAVTLAGVEQTVTAFGFQDKNGWGGNGKPFTANVLSVNVTLNADKSATVSFMKSGSEVQTYTVSAEDTQLTGADVASFNVNNGATNSDRSGGFDNFKTTISVVE